MIDEELFLSLPNDPEHAFALYEAHVREILGDDSDGAWKWQSEYIQYVKAFMLVYKIDIDGIPDWSPQGEEQFDDYVSQFIEASGIKAKASNLKRLQAIRNGISPLYSLEPKQKIEINHHLEAIRSIIAEANITPQKRDALIDRLEAFSGEVNRDRTRLDAFTAMYIFAKREAKEELAPAIEKMEKILTVLEKAVEWIGLSKSAEKKCLPTPQKKIEDKRKSSEPDDDIPF